MNNLQLVKNLSLENKSKDGSIDIIKVALALGLKVYQVKQVDENFNAKISLSDDNESFEILVNGNHSINRQRFSIAHEIAHFVLHKPKLEEKKELYRLCRCENDLDINMEKEADILAEELLIPQEILEEKFLSDLEKDKLVSISKIREISNYFKVSIIVATIRLKNLKCKVPYISFSYIE